MKGTKTKVIKDIHDPTTEKEKVEEIKECLRS